MATTHVLKVSLPETIYETARRMAAELGISLEQWARDAITVQTRNRVEPPGGASTDDAYPDDPAWKLLETAERIGGSGSSDGASRLEEILYGPIES